MTARARPGYRPLRALAALAVVCWAAPAGAQGLEAEVPGVRGIGRAGAVTVSDDTGAALLINPGGLVRRASLRMQLGLGLHDHDLAYEAAGQPGQSAAPEDVLLVEDQGAPARVSMLAVEVPLGATAIAGLLLLDTGARNRALPDPGMDPPVVGDDGARLFPHRYGGTALSYRRQVLAAGAALRAGSWLGLGASVAVSRVQQRERQYVWAGRVYGDGAGDAVGDPARDVAVTVAGDALVPEVRAGALIAPPSLPVELALSAGYIMSARLRGSADAQVADVPFARQPLLDDPVSQALRPDILVLRAGVRYLGERVLLEAGGDLTAYVGASAGAPVLWRLDGVTLQHNSNARVPLTEMPSLADQRAHGALRAALDVEVAAGFLWLTGGYAYGTGASRLERITPVHAALAGHTLAAGAEVYWSGITLTIGYARTLARSVEITATERTWIEPFGTGSLPVGQGRYRSAGDLFGAALELAWE